MTCMMDFGSLRAKKSSQYFVYYGDFAGKQRNERHRQGAKGFLRVERIKTSKTYEPA